MMELKKRILLTLYILYLPFYIIYTYITPLGLMFDFAKEMSIRLNLL